MTRYAQEKVHQEQIVAALKQAEEGAAQRARRFRSDTLVPHF